MIRYLIGLDGGGTGCRARLVRRGPAAGILAEATGGPANIYQKPQEALSNIDACLESLLARAGLPAEAAAQTAVSLGLAGAEIASSQRHLKDWVHPWGHVIADNDAHNACLGAHNGNDGGLVAIGTGTVGYAIAQGRGRLLDGWGFPLADQGGGAWLGQQAIRAMLRASDQAGPQSDLTRRLAAAFNNNPRLVPDWARDATPGDYAGYAPWVTTAAEQGDVVAGRLLDKQAFEVSVLLQGVKQWTQGKLVLTGGLAPFVRQRLPESMKLLLTDPTGDAQSGAIIALEQALATRQKEGAMK